MDGQTIIYLLFILLLATFLGFELISKVPATLHTPLMSGSNAISGITLLGAISLTGQSEEATALSSILGFLAVTFAMTNVVGGYLVTDRMLEMFKKKESSKNERTYQTNTQLFHLRRSSRRYIGNQHRTCVRA